MPPVYSTTLFPDVVGQDWLRWREYQTIQSDPTTAGDQRVAMGGTNILWAYKLGWAVLQLSDAQALLHAFEFMGGETLGLLFFEWIARTYTNVYVGLGDGTSNPVTLPVKGAPSVVVRANGTPVAGTFLAGTGSNGEDQFDPTGTITLGQTIRADFTGRRRRTVRLRSKDSFRLGLRPRATPLLWQANVELIETQATDI